MVCGEEISKRAIMSEEVKKPKGIEEGPPMWVESLMTFEEWKEQRQIRKTYSRKPLPPDPSKYEVFWRRGMGAFLKKEEIDNINHNINCLLTINKL